MLLCFVASELIHKRNGYVAAVATLVHNQVLSFVVYAGVRIEGVEEVVCFQSSFGFLVGKSPFQAGIYFPDSRYVVYALYK